VKFDNRVIVKICQMIHNRKNGVFITIIMI